MTMELIRLIAACEGDLIRRLVDKLVPDLMDKVDWTLSGRELGTRVRDLLKANQTAWVALQKIEGLARHGGAAAIFSVLYDKPRLRAEYEELPEGRETSAVWLALTDDDLFECALSALHVDEGLNKRSWEAYRARLDKGARLSFDTGKLKEFEEHVREAIRDCPTFDEPG